MARWCEWNKTQSIIWPHMKAQNLLRLFGYLRYLYRESPSSPSDRVQEMKSYLKQSILLATIIQLLFVREPREEPEGSQASIGFVRGAGLLRKKTRQM